MIEVELQKLTAAIEALTAELRLAKAGNSLPTETPTNLEEAEKAFREIERATAIKNLSEQRSFENVDVEEVKKAIKAAEKRDQELLDLYKAEQAKAKRKAKVTPEETKALVEASKSALSDVSISMGGSGAAPDDEALAPQPEAVSDITESDLKTMAMEIARADSSARPIILSILGEHGAKTITQLDIKHYHAVHGKLLSLATDIAKNGEDA